MRRPQTIANNQTAAVPNLRVLVLYTLLRGMDPQLNGDAIDKRVQQHVSGLHVMTGEHYRETATAPAYDDLVLTVRRRGLRYLHFRSLPVTITSGSDIFRLPSLTVPIISGRSFPVPVTFSSGHFRFRSFLVPIISGYDHFRLRSFPVPVTSGYDRFRFQSLPVPVTSSSDHFRL